MFSIFCVYVLVWLLVYLQIQLFSPCLLRICYIQYTILGIGENRKTEIPALMFWHSCKPQSFITAARKNHSYPPPPELVCNQQWCNFTAWSLKVLFQEDCSILLYCHLIWPVSSVGDLTNITEVIPENRTVSTSKRDLL